MPDRDSIQPVTDLPIADLSLGDKAILNANGAPDLGTIPPDPVRTVTKIRLPSTFLTSLAWGLTWAAGFAICMAIQVYLVTGVWAVPQRWSIATLTGMTAVAGFCGTVAGFVFVKLLETSFLSTTREILSGGALGGILISIALSKFLRFFSSSPEYQGAFLRISTYWHFGWLTSWSLIMSSTLCGIVTFFVFRSRYERDS